MSKGNSMDTLSQEELARYSRQVLMPGFGVQAQLALRDSRILIVGAGGLGAPVAMYLAAAGVGTIGIVDDDVVDLSNLHRQILHGTGDVGRAKVVSAHEWMASQNPFVEVVALQFRLDASNVLDVVADYDVVIDGSDNFSTRYLVADACAIADKPYVWGSIFRHIGQASVFWHSRGHIFREVFPEAPPAGLVPSCAEAGVLGPVCGVIGSTMAAEAVKLVTSAGEPLCGRMLLYDAFEPSWRTVELPVAGEERIRELPRIDDGAFAADACEVTLPLHEVSARELHGMLAARREGDTSFRLIDVREPEEAEIVRIAEAELVPLSTVEQESAGWPKSELYVVHCKAGIRSQRVANLLRELGFTDVRELAGGIDAWIDGVEPDLARY